MPSPARSAASVAAARSTLDHQPCFPTTIMPTEELAISALKNTILIYEEAGAVHHCFCTEAEATTRMKQAAAEGSGGSMFVSDGMGADLTYAVSPDLRERVEEAKRKLRFDMAIRDALNRHGVPKDRDLRIQIKNAIDDLRETVLRPVS